MLKTVLSISKVTVSLSCVLLATSVASDDSLQLLKDIQYEKQTLKEQIERLNSLEERIIISTDKNQINATSQSTDTILTDNINIEPNHIKTARNTVVDSTRNLTAADLVDDSFKGSWPLFGSDYRLKFGGYFKLDMLYDFGATGNDTQFLIGQIPIDGSAEDKKSGYFNMFLNETRFNFDLRSTKSEVPQQFFIEFDFFGADSNYPRLRHAYMTYGNLLIGQTWATYVELSSLVYLFDFAFGDALFGNRTPQVRWQEQISPEWKWAFAIEKMQTSGIYNPNALAGEASDQLPLATARITQTTEDGLHMLAGLVQQLYWDGGANGKDASAVGWALIYAGRKNILDDSYFTWNLAYGDGTADIIMALTGSESNAVLTSDGNLETRQGYSVALGLGHSWNHEYTSNLSYAITDLEDQERAPDAVQSGHVGHINFIYSPAKNISTGLEYMWGYRENGDGARGDSSRIQTMVKYDF